jgi:uncharacterized protein (DUF2141 family)
MIRIVLTMMMILGSYIGFSQPSEKEELMSVSVSVNNIRSTDGAFYVSLYNSEEGLRIRTPIKSKSFKIVKNSIVVTFEDILKGEYAVGCFHDENDNQLMDFYDDGMPKENYGLSNNHVYYGPPTFEDAKFEVSDTNLTFEIKLF